MMTRTMVEIVGYSTQEEGFCVHDNGINWGNHPAGIECNLVLVQDDRMVTVYEQTLEPSQQRDLQTRTITVPGTVPHENAFADATSALEALAMLHEGP